MVSAVTAVILIFQGETESDAQQPMQKLLTTQEFYQQGKKKIGASRAINAGNTQGQIHLNKDDHT